MDKIEISVKEYKQLKKFQKLLTDESFRKKINELYFLMNQNSDIYMGQEVTDLQFSASNLFDKDDTVWDEV